MCFASVDYIKSKVLAISIAEEIDIYFYCKNVPLAKASKLDLNLINNSIDDEGHEEDGRDWTSHMGLSLKKYAKLRNVSLIISVPCAYIINLFQYLIGRHYCLDVLTQ
jgi:hypothetical protein